MHPIACADTPRLLRDCRALEINPGDSRAQRDPVGCACLSGIPVGPGILDAFLVRAKNIEGFRDHLL